MPQMKGAGVTLAYIFPGLPYWAGVVLVGAVITLNVALGGMKGITLVQAFQYWAKMFAICVPVFVLMAVYRILWKQARGERKRRGEPASRRTSGRRRAKAARRKSSQGCGWVSPFRPVDHQSRAAAPRRSPKPQRAATSQNTRSPIRFSTPIR